MARRLPVGRVACASGADLAAIVISEHAVPRAAWWLPWVTLAGGALVLALTFWLVRWLARRQKRGWLPRRHPVRQELRAEPVQQQVPQQERPAIGPVYNFNFYGPAGETHAAVIRKAITGTAGDATTTEGK